MSSGGPYLFVNVSAASITIPRHDGTGSRVVRSGEGFYGNAFYDTFVLQGMLARQYAELVTISAQVQADDIILRDSAHAGTMRDGMYQLPPWRFQRKATQTPPYYGSDTTTCLGLPKYTLSFPIDVGIDDPVSVTYYFYTSSVNPLLYTHKIQRTERMGENWTYPSFIDLENGFYDLSPNRQVEILLTNAPF